MRDRKDTSVLAEIVPWAVTVWLVFQSSKVMNTYCFNNQERVSNAQWCSSEMQLPGSASSEVSQSCACDSKGVFIQVASTKAFDKQLKETHKASFFSSIFKFFWYYLNKCWDEWLSEVFQILHRAGVDIVPRTALHFPFHWLFPSSYLAVSFLNLSSSIKKANWKSLLIERKAQSSSPARETLWQCLAGQSWRQRSPNIISPIRKTAVCTVHPGCAQGRLDLKERTVC